MEEAPGDKENLLPTPSCVDRRLMTLKVMAIHLVPL